METKEKSVKTYYIVRLVIFSLIGISIFVFKWQIVGELKYFIGGLMLLYGIEEFIYTFSFEKKNALERDRFYVGGIEIIFGLIVLIFKVSFESVCVVWATWSIIREAFEIKEIVTELKTLVTRLISGIESVAMIILFVSLIINQSERQAYIHLYVMLPELVLKSLLPLVDMLVAEKRKSKQKAIMKNLKKI
ncbi:MAG: hypothetical protein J5697_03240, partial [Clostridia bacterium]|nr:hypothetical protein [Clostridia bacterium]